MNLSDLKNKNIHIVGLSGAEGGSIALFLLSLGAKNITGHDFKSAEEFTASFFHYRENLKPTAKKLALQKILTGLRKINYKTDYLAGLDKAEIIFTASSWFRYPENKALELYAAKANNGRLNFWNWYNLLLEFFPGTLIGVTGTAGKGTVTNLLSRLLLTKNKNCILIGDSWCAYDFEKIFKLGKQALIVAEINNRTLKFAPFSQKSPQTAIITNVFSNHLDDHNHSFAEYLQTKLELGKYQKTGDRLLINADDPVLSSLRFPKQTIFYSINDAEAKDIPKTSYFSTGHLLSDAIAAIKVAKFFDCTDQEIKKVLKSFSAREGRMQILGKVKGVTFINDSAATRPEATASAIAMEPKGKVILILEGSRKVWLPKEFDRLLLNLTKYQVKAVFLSGLIAPKLYPLVKKEIDDTFLLPSLADSFAAATKKAKTGDVVLLSPACESFGEFKDYRKRSTKFISEFKKISRKISSKK